MPLNGKKVEITLWNFLKIFIHVLHFENAPIEKISKKLFDFPKLYYTLLKDFIPPSPMFNFIIHNPPN